MENTLFAHLAQKTNKPPKRQQKTPIYFILEVETGYMDGFYTWRGLAEETRLHWDRERPGYLHVLCEDKSPEFWPIPESKYLANWVYRRKPMPKQFMRPSECST